MFKRILILFIILSEAAIVFVASRNVTIDSDRELIVAIDVDMPGYFEVYGQEYGYQFELIKAYAEHAGKHLTVIGSNDTTVRSRAADMIAIPSLHVSDGQKENSIEIYRTSYVILARTAAAKKINKLPAFDLSAALAGKSLIVSSSFRSSQMYKEVSGALNATTIIFSDRKLIDLVESLSSGSYDFLVCEKSEAQIGQALTKGIEEIFEFSEHVAMSIVVNPQSENLKDDFEQWFETYRNGEDYAMLNCLYFDKNVVGQLIAHDNTKEISMFDKMIRRISEDEGCDWRLISAIAYSESQFDPYLTSPKGARGLMQVMPSAARQFNVKVGEMMDPEVNIKIATRLLKRIERSLRMSSVTSQNDKMSIMLASYNCGLGHVIDARNLARKYGDNPDSWEDVSRYLTLKSDPQYTEDEVVKCGYFGSGTQTLAYVDKVIRKYTNYCGRFKK